MLETRMPPASPRTRPADAPPRSASRASASRSSAASSRPAPSVQPRSHGSAALHTEAAPVPRPAPSARRSRLERAEMRGMGMATICTAIVCALLLVHLAAYAQVTRLGIAQAEARGQLTRTRLRNEVLRAERDRLQSPQRVIAAATALGMTPRGSASVEYLRDPSLTVESPEINTSQVQGRPQGEQGVNGGTTEDSRAAASFHH